MGPSHYRAFGSTRKLRIDIAVGSCEYFISRKEEGNSTGIQRTYAWEQNNSSTQHVGGTQHDDVVTLLQTVALTLAKPTHYQSLFSSLLNIRYSVLGTKSHSPVKVDLLIL
jgi:hypothetical protein